MNRVVRPFLLAPALALALIACAGPGAALQSRNGIEIRFEGTERVDAETLRTFARRELARYEEQGRQPVDLSDAAYAIERGLRSQGHARARVTFRAVPDETSPTAIVFDVREGARFTLGTLSFPGATVFENDRLTRMIQGDRGGLLDFGPTVYVRSAVDAGVGGIENLYLLAGHTRVKVGPPEVKFDPAAGRADVEVPIDEGPRYTFGTANLTGVIPPDLADDLRDALDLDGQVYYVRAVSEVESRVLRLLREGGHVNATVRGEAVVDDAAARVALTVHVDPGPRLSFADLDLTGADRTRRAFVRSRLGFRDGDLLRGSQLDEAMNALYRTGVFRTVDLTVRPLAEATPDGTSLEPAPARVLVDVDEREARSLEAMIGYGSYEKIRGSVGYRDRHLAGTGRVLDGRLFGSLKSAGAELRVSDPYLLGRDHLLTVGGRYEIREEPSFDERSFGADLSVRSRLGSAVTLDTGYRLRAADAEDRTARVRGVEEDGFVRTAGVFAQVVHDTRNDVLFPSGGHRALLRLEYNVPELGGELEFWEVDVNVGRYVPLAEGTVLALGARLNVREVLDEQRSLPIQERLFLGGDTSVRSFEESELGPSDRSGDPRGGLSAFQAHLELRQRLSGGLDGAVFYDVGTVGPESFRAGNKWGQAIGIGLRYRLPVGPVRLDVGYNPGERFAADRPFAIHLSFGFSF